MLTLWFLGCLAMMCLPPAITVAARPLLIIPGLMLSVLGWLVLLRIAPDIGMGGGLLLLGILAISVFTTIGAGLVRLTGK